MRRGRPSLGGWRSDNPRHFRPRGSGTSHYRPPRPYGMLDGPRCLMSGPRFVRPPHFMSHPNNGDRGSFEPNERNQYRSTHQNDHGFHNRGHYRGNSTPRPSYIYTNQIRRKDNDSSHDSSRNLYDNTQSEQQHFKNNTRNVDHRSAVNNQNHNYHKQKLNLTWSTPMIDIEKHNHDLSPKKVYRNHENTDQNKSHFLDYPSHRPPSSDYYGSNPSPVETNNSAFSRSVDDTVDIIRKKLLNRNEPQAHPDDNKSSPFYDRNESDPSNIYQNEPAVKKKVQRQKQTTKLKCENMKNKIIHQLFKMDKDKIHKLMDNPSSSTKFEYAISSLITESQISLNRHMRSAAEKSLCSSSTDFIQNDNNTIYEDTFMKQMQCILDPQDTVLLEDLKPVVMAELSKFLQIEDCKQNYDRDHVNYHPIEDFDDYNWDEYSHKTYNEDQTAELLYDKIENYKNIDFGDTYQNSYTEYHKPLYKRRSRKSSDYSEERRQSSESRRKSIENRPIEEPYQRSPLSNQPLFDVTTEQLIEEDDPFAELDKQYHVPVDHNFIQTDIYASPQPSTTSSTKSNYLQSEISNVSVSNTQQLSNHTNINNNFDSEVPKMDMMSLKSQIDETDKAIKDATEKLELKIKCEFIQSSPEKKGSSLKCDTTEHKKYKDISIKDEDISNKTKQIDKKEHNKSDDSNHSVKLCSQSNARKRSIDQRPSHRKEKRKKSESDKSLSSHESTYHNNEDSSHSKNREKDNNVKKPFIYSYFPKTQEKKEEKIIKESKKGITNDKIYSDKYVKRKESSKRKEINNIKKSNSNSIMSSLPSPKENIDADNSSFTPTKSDSKAKLKPIDMFVEQPKKLHVHQAHRNTALPSSALKKDTEASNKIKEVSTNVNKGTIKRLVSKETQTSTLISCMSKSIQTENKKLINAAIQTDPVCYKGGESNSTDTLDRMKEIDLEIQVLLQEKFKLYSSLENKDSCHNSMHTLGMTVVNVPPIEDTTQEEIIDNITDLTTDPLTDDLTNIAIEELEQIALESDQEHKSKESGKRTRRLTQKNLHTKSNSTASNARRTAKKARPPNISLLEQIITDDRPLEDIIGLEELETSPVKKKSHSKKKSLKKTKGRKQKMDLKSYNLKEFSIVLERINVNKNLRDNENREKEINVTSGMIVDSSMHEVVIDQPNVDMYQENLAVQGPSFATQQSSEEVAEIGCISTELIEEDNNISFDMLDISEDIVIGDNCEVKFQDKDSNERIEMQITEDIILDNSQSSCDDLNALYMNHGVNECKTYDYSSDENLRRDSITVTGNADAVLAIECVENNFLAACLDGNVYHFNCDGQLLNTLKGSNLAVTCITIVSDKFDITVYTGSLDSRIRYYDLKTGVEKGPECNVLSPIQTMDRAWDTIFVGTRTGFVLQFACKNNMLIPVSTVKFSEQSILALRAMKEGPRKVLLVAARSENVTIKDAQSGLLLRTLEGPSMTVYSLLFEDGKVYCGTSSHQIHVFDYSTGTHVGTHEGGKGAVCLRATGGLLFAGCYDGCVYVYREGETRPLAQLRGPSLMLLSLALVGNKIIAGYKDRSLYIWKIPLNILQELIL